MEEPSGESELGEDLTESNCGKVRWILNKGWGLGKKVLVTGMVISSAPIVLLPLVVISAIGFAVSVPSGIVLASYACTEKIMGKLLPYGEPPLLSENNGTLLLNNEEFEQDEERERGTWVGGKTDIEKEEGWDWRDRFEGGKMRVEFVDKENDDIIKEDAQGNVIEEVDEIVEENGYEEDVDESTTEEEKLILESIYEVKFEGLSDDFKNDSVLDENQVDEVCGLVLNVIEGHDTDDQMGVTPIEVTTIVIEESEGQERGSDIVEEEELVEGQERVSDIVEEEELVEETRGLLEKIRDEGNADNAMEMDKQYGGETEGGGKVRNKKIGLHVEDTEIPVEATIADIGSQETTSTMEVGVGEVRDECEGMHGFQEMRYPNQAKTVSEDVKPTRDIESVSETKNVEKNLEVEKPFGDTKNVNDILEEEKTMAETINLKPVVSNIVEDKQKPVIIKEETLRQGRRTEDTMNDVDFQLIKEKETVVSSNAYARDIADESGLHLFNDKNVSGPQDWHASYETSEGPSGHVGEEGADHAELPVSSVAHESTDSGMSSGKDFNMHSNVVLYDEAKIWKKIDAMRSIVGYKGIPHATCIEELKALYLFTGVEPPTISFSDPPDLAQVNHKLRFLMSIIGVKSDS